MCEYMETNLKTGAIMCKPKNSVCLFCVLGNQKRYNEIKKESK